MHFIFILVLLILICIIALLYSFAKKRVYGGNGSRLTRRGLIILYKALKPHKAVITTFKPKLSPEKLQFQKPQYDKPELIEEHYTDKEIKEILDELRNKAPLEEWFEFIDKFIKIREKYNKLWFWEQPKWIEYLNKHIDPKFNDIKNIFYNLSTENEDKFAVSIRNIIQEGIEKKLVAEKVIEQLDLKGETLMPEYIEDIKPYIVEKPIIYIKSEGEIKKEIKENNDKINETKDKLEQILAARDKLEQMMKEKENIDTLHEVLEKEAKKIEHKKQEQELKVNEEQNLADIQKQFAEAEKNLQEIRKKQQDLWIQFSEENKAKIKELKATAKTKMEADKLYTVLKKETKEIEEKSKNLDKQINERQKLSKMKVNLINASENEYNTINKQIEQQEKIIENLSTPNEDDDEELSKFIRMMRVRGIKKPGRMIILNIMLQKHGQNTTGTIAEKIKRLNKMITDDKFPYFPNQSHWAGFTKRYDAWVHTRNFSTSDRLTIADLLSIKI